MILYHKAKSVKTRKWIAGLLYFENNLPFLTTTEWDSDKQKYVDYKEPIITSTLSLESTIYDSKANMIYQGDIVKVNDKKFYVVFERGTFFLMDYKTGKMVPMHELCKYDGNIVTWFIPNSEVVGNIHDNPDILYE